MQKLCLPTYKLPSDNCRQDLLQPEPFVGRRFVIWDFGSGIDWSRINRDVRSCRMLRKSKVDCYLTLELDRLTCAGMRPEMPVPYSVSGSFRQLRIATDNLDIPDHAISSD